MSEYRYSLVEILAEHADKPDDPLATPDAVWYVRPPSGGQYGPARSEVMRKWLDEGRVSADSLVWREGWEQWQKAGPVFPELDDSGPPKIEVTAEPEPSKTERPTSVSVRSAARKRKSNQKAVTIFATLVVLTAAVLGILLWVLLSR